jgi:chorismate mutase/prephenate dehydratase
MTRAPSSGAIDALRGEIDEIDDQLLGLLNRRAALACQIGRLKAAVQIEGQTVSIDMRVPERESEIIARLEGANGGPFPRDAIAPIFGQIFAACLGLQNSQLQN